MNLPSGKTKAFLKQNQPNKKKLWSSVQKYSTTLSHPVSLHAYFLLSIPFKEKGPTTTPITYFWDSTANSWARVDLRSHTGLA